jgi:hypothetical protein
MPRPDVVYLVSITASTDLNEQGWDTWVDRFPDDLGDRLYEAAVEALRVALPAMPDDVPGPDWATVTVREMLPPTVELCPDPSRHITRPVQDPMRGGTVA